MHQGRLISDQRTDSTSREEVVAAMVGSTDQRQITPVIWALESYHRARERAEMLHKRQVLYEQGLAEDDDSRKQFFEQWSDQLDALDHANRALQDAQRRLLTEREEERKFVAREIHDLIIQELVGLNYELDELKRAPSTTLHQSDKLDDIREEVGDLVDDLRHICGTLRPPTIDSMGLGTALQSFVHDWEKRTSIAVNLDLGVSLGRLPEEIELSIFRMIQEGLNNIRNHAEATHVEIILKQTSPRTLVVSITDDGCGLPANFDLSMLASNGHYGLLGISERVALLGGRLKIQNQQDGPGLSIQAEIPHPRRT
jgi:signal transduction histidine kinase